MCSAHLQDYATSSRNVQEIPTGTVHLEGFVSKKVYVLERGHLPLGHPSCSDKPVPTATFHCVNTFLVSSSETWLMSSMIRSPICVS